MERTKHSLRAVQTIVLFIVSLVKVSSVLNIETLGYEYAWIES